VQCHRKLNTHWGYCPFCGTTNRASRDQGRPAYNDPRLHAAATAALAQAAAGQAPAPLVGASFTERLLGGESALGERHVPGPVVSTGKSPQLPGSPGGGAGLGDTSVR
jgi:hypothetical protein